MVKTKLLGLQQEEDQLTKLLFTNKDLIKSKQERMVLFDANGPIIPEAAKLEDSESDEESKESDESSVVSIKSEKALLDELRLEISTNQQKKKEIHQALKIPEFKKDENDYNFDEVSSSAATASSAAVTTKGTVQCSC